MQAEGGEEYLFVYGTLRRGAKHPMAGVLGAASIHVGRAMFQGRLYRVSWYPAAVASDMPEDRVTGDVFRIHPGRAEPMFRALDDYEGTTPEADGPAYYRRERVKIALEAGGEIEAWIYLYNRPTERLRRIESGDFLAG